ncbi:MAG TPA: MarR family transcriptional regulator [Solirubrobacteraceae bacterium]|nr:MarR family transcriptional regulator [Solirubrobacteraceae bacterium]
MKTDVELTNELELRALAAELRIVLGRLIRRLRAEYRFGLTQASVLGRLDREGPQYIGELAAAERVRPQSMSQALDELEAEKLIERCPDATDGRRTRIALTPGGRAALEADRAARDGWLGREIVQFTPKEQEILRQAVLLLDRLANSD